MAGKLPPLPEGAQMLPPLPPGAEMVSATSTPAKPEEGIGSYLKQEIADPVMAAVDRLKYEFKHPDKAEPTVGSVLAVPGAAIGGAVDAAIVNPVATGLSYLHPQRLDNPWHTLIGGKPFVRPETKAELKSDVSGIMSALGPEARAAAPAAAVPSATDIGVEAASPIGKAAEKVAAKGKPPQGTSALSPQNQTPPPGTPPVTPDHQKSIDFLKKEGVYVTPGMEKGGWWRRQEEAHKSNPLVGQAIRDAENKSINSMNVALYNRALGQIGQKYEGEVVGNEGVKKLGDTLSAEFERLKPKLKMTPDDQFVDDVIEHRGSGWRLPEAQQKQLESFINEKILNRLGPDGSFDGETFKRVESELTAAARAYKAPTATASEKELGHVLEDINGALRDNLERSSSPEVRAELKKLNTAWAILRRIEDAAATRTQSGGIITVGDLMGAVRKAGGRRAFARGDALLQDFGSHAAKVIPNRLPDSGTPERMAFNKWEGIIQGAAGAVTNPAAAKVIERAGLPPTPPVMSPAGATPGAAGAFPGLSLSDAMQRRYELGGNAQ